MTPDHTHAQTLRFAIASCARSCSALNEACATALEAAIARGSSELQPDGELLMDCWHLAGTTARMLSRYADYDPTHTAMQLSVCRHVTTRAATSCDRAAPGPLRALGAAAGTCAAACAIVLELIWDRALDPIASWDDRYAPVDVIPEELASYEDDDEPVRADVRSRRVCARATL